MESVLLLNATYEPLALMPLRRAVKLLLKDRAEPVVADGLLLTSPGLTMLVPAVLRLKFYVYLPDRRAPSWTRRGLLARDNHTCAYCGKRCAPREATIDHVFPSRAVGAPRGETPLRPALRVTSARQTAHPLRQG